MSIEILKEDWIRRLKPGKPGLIHAESKDTQGQEWKYQFFTQKGNLWKEGLPHKKKDSFFFLAISGEVIQSKTGKNPLESNISGKLKGVSIKAGNEEIHFFASSSSESKAKDPLRRSGIKLIGSFWLEPFQEAESEKNTEKGLLIDWLKGQPIEKLPPGFEFSISYNKSLYHSLEKRIIRIWIPILIAIFLTAMGCDKVITTMLRKKSEHIKMAEGEQEKGRLQREELNRIRDLFEGRNIGVYNQGAFILDKVLGTNSSGDLNLLAIDFEDHNSNSKSIKLEGRVQERRILIECISRMRQLPEVREVNLLEYIQDGGSSGKFKILISA